MNEITVVLTYYNSERYMSQCIQSLVNQINQNFDLVIVNDGSTDDSENVINSELEGYEKDIKYVNLNDNFGQGYARNKGIAYVQTPHFLIMNPEDHLSPFAIDVFLKNLKDNDGIIFEVTSLTKMESLIYEENYIKTETFSVSTDKVTFLKKGYAGNVIFKTEIIRENDIHFDECGNVYIDVDFLISYINKIKKYIYISGLPFYIKREIYHSYVAKDLEVQSDDKDFKFFFEKLLELLDRENDKDINVYLKGMLINRVKKEFDPSKTDIKERYYNNEELLAALSKELKSIWLKKGAPLFRLEMLLLSLNKIKAAYTVNKIRFSLRHLKKIISNSKDKHRSWYQLTNEMTKVSKNTIVFESFGGKSFSDSPKAIYEYMKDKYPEFEYVWVINDFNKDVPRGIKVVIKGSSEYYKMYSKAKVWISNARLPLYLNKKKNQLYIQTWHGTPLKRLANDMFEVKLPGVTTKSYKQEFLEETKRWDYLISPNRYSTTIFQSAFWFPSEKILEIGYPRNDKLLKLVNDNEYLSMVKQKLGIPSGKKVILYAPTWRDDEYIDRGNYSFNLKLDLEKFKKQLGDDYIILLRLHYLISNSLDLKSFKGFAFDVSNYNDISDLYLISDVLITDYSSVMFDYGILRKPQLFFAYDIEKYSQELRGFYMDYVDNIPGPLYTTSNEVLKGIKNLDGIAEKYKGKIEDFYMEYCSLENGNASAYVGELVKKYMLSK